MSGHFDQLRALLPPGAAVPSEPGSRLDALLGVAAAELERIEAGAGALHHEIQPGIAVELLGDYERVLGPDPCLGPQASLPLAARQSIAQQRWTAAGGATPAFFIALGAALGIEVEVIESQPWEVGVASVDDELIAEAQRFEWRLLVRPGPLLTEAGAPLLLEDGQPLRLESPSILTAFEVGVSDVDTPLEGFTRSPIECFARRHAPAHTFLFFAYG